MLEFISGLIIGMMLGAVAMAAIGIIITDAITPEDQNGDSNAKADTDFRSRRPGT